MITFPGSSPRQYLRVRLSTYSSGAVVPGQNGKNPVAAPDHRSPLMIRPGWELSGLGGLWYQTGLRAASGSGESVVSAAC